MTQYLSLPRVIAFVTLAFLSAAPLLAQQDQPSPDQVKLVSSLNWKTGVIPIPSANTTLTVSPNFRYLDTEDARKVLEQIWHNPPQTDVLGMIFPKDLGPLDDAGWGVTIEYDDSGHTSDSDASTINYDELLKSIQQQVLDSDDERVKQGFPKMELLGWAEPPHYDKESHKLYWAKNFKVGASGASLNYDLRVLGRSGTLILSAIATPDQLHEIDGKTGEILSMFEFNQGSRYEDYNSSTDKLAEGGLAALIAGGVGYGAVKLGLLALVAKFFFSMIAYLGAFLAAFGKVVAIGVAAVGAAIAKFFGNIFGQKTVKLPNDRDRRE